MPTIVQHTRHGLLLGCALSTLAFADTAAPPFQPRLVFGAPLEPATTVLHGAGQDVDGFIDYTHALGTNRQPAVYMTYANVAGGRWAMTWWGWWLRRDLARAELRDVIPQIGLSMAGGNDTGASQAAAVANGARDETIAAFGDIVEALHRPVFVRIGYEFDGQWNGYPPADYRAAFVRVAQALRTRKLPVATVWCSAGASAGRRSTDKLMGYYPGDAWVDWWGLDVFASEDLTGTPTVVFCEAAATHHKPVMIGESTPRGIGVLKGQASWDAWFKPYFALIRRRPEIKAFCYINWDWQAWSHRLGFHWKTWGDARLERNAEVLRLYQDEMSSPLYQHRPSDP